MLATIWSGAADASDVFLLIAAILAAVAVVLDLVGRRPRPTGDGFASAGYFGAGVFVAAAVAFVALGLLAL